MLKLLVAILLIATPVYASGFCSQVELMAVSVMDSRQAGVSLKQMLEITEGNGLATALAHDAYEVQVYRSEKYQARAVNDFANDWYKACLKSNKAK